MQSAELVGARKRLRRTTSVQEVTEAESQRTYSLVAKATDVKLWRVVGSGRANARTKKPRPYK